MQENIFTQSTRLLNLGKYQQGLEKISSCILVSPSNSMLYSNRALFYYQLKDNDKAIHDLTTAINKNYLNYIAYFNLFSIELRLGGLEKEAFQDLCCSLSILYFLRGKQLKTQIDIQKSIKYCENNIQAHILKAMMHLQNNKLKLAANQVQWALQYSPDNIILKRLRYFLHQKIGYKNQDEQFSQNSFQIEEKYQSQRNFRLECSLEFDEQTNIGKEIQSKLLQFTQIYNHLNSIYGTVTQRFIVGSEHTEGVQRSIISHVSGIWESGKKSQIFIQRESPKLQQNIANQEDQFNGQASSKFLSDHDINEQTQIQEQEKREEQEEPQINEFCPLQNFVKDDTQQGKEQFDVSKKTDFLIANEREEIQQDDKEFLVEQQKVNNHYESYNKIFFKKDSSKSFGFVQNQQESNKIQQNKVDKNLQNYTEQYLLNQMEFQVPLPVPLNPQNNNLLGEAQNYQNQNDEPKQINHKQKSEGFLNEFNDTNHVPSYGEILTKQNNNMEFHESQVIQPQTLTNQQNQTVQNTLINDLMSETSRKSHQSFNSFTDLQNKNLIEQRLKKIKQKVSKNLENSAKKLSQKQSFENDIRSSQKLSEKSSQKIQSIQLYPYTLPKKQIFFTFNNVQFSKKYKFAQLNEIYLVAVYHLTIPKYKMKTQPKKLQGTICNWCEKFPEMNLHEQQKSLKITVFNKGKGTKARDQLLGECEKEVTETGNVRLPLYDKKNLIGYVKFSINLM